MLEWVSRYPQLNFTAVLSEANAAEAAHHRVGWVHEAVLADHPQLAGFEVYAAGPPAMIEAIRASFPRHGLAAERLYFDSFDYAPDARTAALSLPGRHERQRERHHAAITGWGKCLPPAVLTNHDLSTILDTSDEWIVSRTGIRERRISHVGLEELAYVAAARALAAAGLAGRRHRAHRVRHLQPRRPGAQHGLRHPGCASARSRRPPSTSTPPAPAFSTDCRPPPR